MGPPPQIHRIPNFDLLYGLTSSAKRNERGLSWVYRSSALIVTASRHTQFRACV